MLVRRGGKREVDHSQAAWENHCRRRRHWHLTMTGARAASDGGSARLSMTPSGESFSLHGILEVPVPGCWKSPMKRQEGKSNCY